MLLKLVPLVFCHGAVDRSAVFGPGLSICVRDGLRVVLARAPLLSELLVRPVSSQRLEQET